MNNNVLGDALKKALETKKNDYSNFIWKGEKVKKGDKFVQESIRIIDMTPEEIKRCYNHCLKMLYNDDPKNYGRFNILKETIEQINKCNVELLLRYFENKYLQNEYRGAIERTPTLVLNLRQLMANNPEIEDWSKVKISKITDDLPTIFKDVSIKDVLDGCIDYLGAFSKQHLTMTFITKMGLWFTKAEEYELKGASNTERLQIAKEKLRLPSKLILRFNERGLSYHEMRAILTLPKKQKYKDMTTEQLVTLRDKVLPRFQMEVDKHIYNWKKLMEQFELVAKSKGIELND